LTSTTIKYGSVIIQVDRASDTALPIVYLNSIAKELVSGNMIEVGDKGQSGSIVLGDSFDDQDGSASVFIDLIEFGHRVVVTASVGDDKAQWLQVFPKPPLSSLKTASGLMGKYDPNNNKNLIDAFDNVQPASYTADAMDIDKWKVTVDSNIISTNSPKPDANAKITRRDVSSYSSTDVAAANEACSGVALRESCMEDFLSTEGDKGMAYSYGTLEQLVTSAEPSEFVNNLVVKNDDDDDDLSIDKKTFILICAGVGLAVVVVVAVLVALVIRSRQSSSPKRYEVVMD